MGKKTDVGPLRYYHIQYLLATDTNVPCLIGAVLFKQNIFVAKNGRIISVYSELHLHTRNPVRNLRELNQRL